MFKDYVKNGGKDEHIIDYFIDLEKQMFTLNKSNRASTSEEGT